MRLKRLCWSDGNSIYNYKKLYLQMKQLIDAKFISFTINLAYYKTTKNKL
jgi:hypothetical protein